MNKNIKYFILITSLFICVISLFSTASEKVEHNLSFSAYDMAAPEDTGTIYPVKNTQISNYEDLKRKSPIDLRDPSNVETQVEYDTKHNVYLFRTKIDNDEWVTPFTLNPQQYLDYSLKQSMSRYFKQKNDETFAKKDEKEAFSLKDIRVNMGALERIFGPGGVQVKTQGYVELSMGLKKTSTDNPTLSQKNRSRTMFDFDEKIQVNVNASVGDKVNFGLNYDTEATFDFDSKKAKLAYEGKEDEIIRYLEAGNVSMNTTNSLITGGTSLFGIRADLQFGKLKVNTVISQKETQSRTASSSGGVQTTPFEFKADQYDENQHFFLGQYFRDNYDVATSKLPYVQSPVLITKIEVWVTNKQGKPDKTRNIVAFADIGEYDKIGNPLWQKGSVNVPDNKANNLYSTINSSYSAARNKDLVNDVLTGAGLQSGQDFEKLENARELDPSEYTFNPKLGYISLNSALMSDQVLAVAYEYNKGAETYKVGEFASDEIPSQEGSAPKSGSLFLKLLKPVALYPQSYTWDLMMKNIYKLGSIQIQKEKFRLNISYQSDSVGTYTNYIPEGNIKNKLLLRVMNLDRLNSANNAAPDGIFDFLEGYTINVERGRIIFPVVEPFGTHLRKQIGNDAIADKYVYQELYDSTLTVAQQTADKNKFKISGSYRASASSGSVLNLNSMNVTKGSVKVTANGTVLTENVDYTVDYIAGTVTIINQSLIDTGTPINVSLEDQSMYSMQRQTLLGLNLSYDFTKNFNVGATILHMYEKPLTYKSSVGEEALKNTVWGLNTSYRTQSQWLTNLIDKLPFVNATAPSEISLNAEFAQMIPGHYENQYSGGYSYLDDFEAAKTRISLISAYGWKLSSTPSMFEESKLTNDITYGNNRAQFAWFNIDNLFTRNTSRTPKHITPKDLDNPYVREINIKEIYPGKEVMTTEASTITALNLSYYPTQRGPYNLDAANTDSEGRLLNPDKRWGGITRKLDNTNFENSNIEYIEFWMLDPFIDNENNAVKNTGGDLYFNLGEISEDVLKDGKKFYENGLPSDPSSTEYETTAWGRVPTRQSTSYAFDNTLSNEARARQDVGFNGLSTADELKTPVYATYINDLRSKLSPSAIGRMEQDPFSPFNDPAGDNYHYYRGSDYDEQQVSILDRYKYFNGTEGNTITNTNESYSTAASSVPDVEDINQDYTMNESENYYQYKVSLNPNTMTVGSNYISEIREVPVVKSDGNESKNKWYLFKIPLNDYNKNGNKKVGNIQGFKTIRFMRMFLTNFSQETYLRFATLDLVRGEWRTYTQALQNDINQGQGTINVSAVNIEENGNKTPVNYVVPPGVKRIIDSNQSQLVEDNEQALALQVLNLEPYDARAIYKNTVYDLRRYKRLQMFTHAEELVDGPDIGANEMTVFLRLGSDYKNNYYEYEIPLSITPPGKYNTKNPSDQEKVWPRENMFDIPLKLLTNLKLERNKEKRKAGSDVSYTKLYSSTDPDNQKNKVSIIGNPSLSDVQVMMIGVRNNSRTTKSAEVWVNELRLTDFDEEGGWAAQGNLNVKLSDIGSVNFTGRKETIGFGSIDQSLNERRSDDYSTYTIATNLDLGRFIPEKVKASIPFFYSYSNQTTTPKYDPLNQDITLKESLDLVDTKAEKDSIKNLAQDKTITKSLSFSNVKFDIRSKTPMPYDPANFTFGYAYSKTEVTNPTTTYDITKNYKATLNYSYSPGIKTWEPFKNMKSKAPLAKYPKSLGINLLPSNISFNSYITRFYTETLTRDLDSYTIDGDNRNNEFLTWSQTFYWDRDFSINWDLLRNLKISLQTGTRAEIENEPYLQVDKDLSRGDYEIRRDSIARTIKNLGNPLSYKQAAKVTYALPFNNIPFLSWITSSANYDSQYTWDRGARIDSVSEIGNTITNNITFSTNNKFDLTALYNKSPFLKKVNNKFNSNRGRPTNRRQEKAKPERLKRFSQEIRLNPDSSTIVAHNLNSKRIDVVARRDGRIFKLKYKRINENSIRITLQDTASIQLSIMQKGNPEETTLYKIAEYAARGLMSVRSFSINYSLRNETAIGGFRPGIGDAFGQKRTEYGITPGLDFAFGLKGGEEYLNRALRNGWLILDENNISPAVYNSIQKLELEAMLEPARGLKIRLNALREKNDRTSFQYYNYPSAMRKTFGGSFTITTISLSSSFDSGNSKNGYHSKAFEKFRKNREIITNRWENKFNGTEYPNVGFIAQSGLGGSIYETGARVNVNQNSSDVLIPAFLAAYTGRNVNSISLNPFPALSSLLPNWRITYDGLISFPWFRDKFKNIILTHAYTSQYNVGSYGSFSSWIDAGNGLGFIKTLDEDPLPAPSSGYDISAVSLIEQFNPLFGAEGTMNNNLIIKARYNYTRALNLNINSFQIIENLQKDLIVGLGYRINEFNKIMGWNKKKQSGFNNDLIINADLSRKTNQSLIRKIEDGFTDATSGTTILTLKISADYSLSKALIMRAYFDKIVNSPLISTSSYPTSNTNFGISLRFTLSE